MDWDQLKTSFLRYRQGDDDAAERVFRAISLRLSRYYALRTGSTQDAQDLTQAALLKVHFARDRFDAALSLKTWVFTIASRTLIDLWRSAKPEDLGGDAVEAFADTSLPESVRLEFNDALQKALRGLKPLDQSIVYLYGVEQLSMAEVAATVGVTEGAAKVRAHRAYVKLRESLSE